MTSFDNEIEIELYSDSGSKSIIWCEDYAGYYSLAVSDLRRTDDGFDTLPMIIGTIEFEVFDGDLFSLGIVGVGSFSLRTSF